jgi:hypothetical protein
LPYCTLPYYLLPFWYKIKLFLFFFPKKQTKLFIICVKILIKSKLQLSGLNCRPSVRLPRHTRIFHNIYKNLFIILYNCYILKISELKNRMPNYYFKFKFKLIIWQFVAEMVKVLGYAGIPVLIVHSNKKALVHSIIYALEKGHRLLRLLGPGNCLVG